jgi:hypothetical protein
VGGGASSIALDDLLQTTLAIGNAIAAVSFPGMYRIYDFHSKKAPKLKNISIGMPSMFGAVSFNFEQDTNGEDEDEPNPDVYLKFFSVELGSEKIYIEDPTEINNCGWTPLHTCCMSFSTVPAGIKLIDEYLNRGFTLDSKTYNGPGSFNRDCKNLIYFFLALLSGSYIYFTYYIYLYKGRLYIWLVLTASSHWY